MEHIDCSACCKKTPARPPNKGFLGLIVAFWVGSVFLGFGAAQGNGWSFVLGSAWFALATSVVLLARRATSWTCADCGSAVMPPLVPTSAPPTAGIGGAHLRHA